MGPTDDRPRPPAAPGGVDDGHHDAERADGPATADGRPPRWRTLRELFDVDDEPPPDRW